MLRSPAKASVISGISPRLEWYASSGATSYEVHVSTSALFTNLLVDQGGLLDIFYDVPDLSWDTTYYWRVNSRNSSGSTSKWSTYSYFRTAAGPPPRAPSGLVANAVSPSRIDLVWVDNSDDESGFGVDRKTATGIWSQIARLPADTTAYSSTWLISNTTCYFRVRALGTGTYSDYTNEASATTWPPLPRAPILKLPARGSVVSSLAPRLEWYPSNGSLGYSLQVSTGPTFSTMVLSHDVIVDTFFNIPTGLLNGNTYYYWRVNARNGSGVSGWSTYSYFRTPAG